MNETDKAATIKDVAELSRVSLATVSRVINGGKGVRPALYEKVNRAIAQLGYNPNRAAQTLAGRKTGSIGIVVNNLHDPFFYDLLRGFEDGAQETKYNVVFCSVSGNDAEGKAKYVKYLTNGVVDAVVLYGSYHSDEHLVNYLQKETTCDYVIIENDLPELNCNELLIDNLGGARQAVEFLHEQGHEKIAHICGNPNKKVTIDRMNGYLNTMHSLRLMIEPSYIQNTSSNYRSGYECMRRLMSLEERPTAVFCSDDAIASFAVRAALDMGLSIPGDVSVMGFDNQAILPDKYRGPEITTVEQPLYIIGRDSVRLLTERLETKGEAELLKKTYPTKVIIKETVGAPAALK